MRQLLQPFAKGTHTLGPLFLDSSFLGHLGEFGVKITGLTFP